MAVKSENRSGCGTAYDNAQLNEASAITRQLFLRCGALIAKYARCSVMKKS